MTSFETSKKSKKETINLQKMSEMIFLFQMTYYDSVT